MKSKTHMIHLMAVLTGIFIMLSLGMAHSADNPNLNAGAKKALLNEALNESFDEKNASQNSYKSHPSASRPDDSRRTNDSEQIAVEVGDELPSSDGSANLRSWVREHRELREANVASKLDRELRDIDRSYAREAREFRSSQDSQSFNRSRSFRSSRGRDF